MVNIFEPQIPNINLDFRQNIILRELEASAEIVNKGDESLKEKFFRYLNKKKDNISGIYLHGGVGRGKTMLMKKFFDMVNVKKELVHYQNFMQIVHTKLHKLQNQSAERAVFDLAEEIAGQSRVLCLDEFEIKDITDAMLIMHLFKFLIQKKVFIFITTNVIPENLYQDGLHRELFLPFIEMVETQFSVLYLGTENDYRLKNLKYFNDAGSRILYPFDDRTAANSIKIIKKKLCNNQADVTSDLIYTFGREVKFEQTYNENILFTNFNELIARDFGYADYVNICQKYRVIVVEDITEIKENQTDLIIRFINFIDNAYFYKVLLFVSLKKAPEEIYQKGKRINEFKRTISRLHEMNNDEYFKIITKNEDIL